MTIGTFEDTVVITTTTPSCADATAGGPVLKTDLNKDCYVNIQDLAMMVENWTQVQRSGEMSTASGRSKGKGQLIA